MAEEKDITNLDTGSLDDVSVLRELLHTIRGLSPVSANEFLVVPEAVETDDA